MATLYGHIGGVPARAGVRAVSDNVKEFLGNVAAHVPAEVVGVYVVGLTTAPAYATYWTLFCWIGSIALRWFATTGQGKVQNVILAAIAFPIWALALGGNLFGWAPEQQLVSLAVLGFSIIGGLLYNNK
ncbi:MAG: hypothetical protein LC138_04895 [Anaerolineales bacterium]|nr:hypothetical protein [Anaerolineales bacterium]